MRTMRSNSPQPTFEVDKGGMLSKRGLFARARKYFSFYFGLRQNTRPVSKRHCVPGTPAES